MIRSRNVDEIFLASTLARVNVASNFNDPLSTIIRHSADHHLKYMYINVCIYISLYNL